MFADIVEAPPAAARAVADGPRAAGPGPAARARPPGESYIMYEV